MVSSSVGVPPLYNMGGGVSVEKSNLYVGIDSEVLEGFRVACDKLILSLRVGGSRELGEEFFAGSWGPWKRLRNHGSTEVEQRKSWVFDYQVLLLHKRQRGTMLGAEQLLLQFNPNKSWALLPMIGGLVAQFGRTLADAYVDRFDVCWTAPEDPYRLIWDSRYSKPDGLGGTSRGFETHRVGYRKGVKVKAQRYDKSAEARAAGEDVPDGDLARVEFQCWGRPSPDDPGQLLLFDDLDRVEWPAPAHYRLLRVRPAERFSHPVYRALADVAVMSGAKCARALAAQLLEGPARDRARNADFSLFDDLTDSLRACFASSWPWAVRAVRRAMESGMRDSMRGVGLKSAEPLPPGR